MSDTSPLRALQAVGRVELLREMFGSVLVPPAVARELRVAVAGLGPFPLEGCPFISERAPTDAALVRSLLDEIDEGEAQAVALAAEMRAELLLVDDRRGRRAAERAGLRFVGVAGLLVRAKLEGRVEAVAPLFDTLAARIGFRLAPATRRAALAAANEGESAA